MKTTSRLKSYSDPSYSLLHIHGHVIGTSLKLHPLRLETNCIRCLFLDVKNTRQCKPKAQPNEIP